MLVLRSASNCSGCQSRLANCIDSRCRLSDSPNPIRTRRRSAGGGASSCWLGCSTGCSPLGPTPSRDTARSPTSCRLCPWTTAGTGRSWSAESPACPASGHPFRCAVSTAPAVPFVSRSAFRPAAFGSSPVPAAGCSSPPARTFAPSDAAAVVRWTRPAAYPRLPIAAGCAPRSSSRAVGLGAARCSSLPAGSPTGRCVLRAIAGDLYLYRGPVRPLWWWSPAFWRALVEWASVRSVRASLWARRSSHWPASSGRLCFWFHDSVSHLHRAD